MGRFLFLSACCLILVSGPARATEERPVILVLGDSLSAAFGMAVEQGWVARLQRRLDAEGYGYRVINASISGETTVGGLERLPRALDQHAPAVVIIELGGNDGLRGLPVDQLEVNLESMIMLSREAGSEVVLTGIRVPTNYGPQYAEEFFAVYARLANSHCIWLVPFLLKGVALNDDLFQPDGLHPSVEAQVVMLDNVWPALAHLLTERSTCRGVGQVANPPER